ncbi:hypothetical protein V3C99_007630 [Haemonchus contortus]|uniref:Serpentine receptor class gamma n=1 Tax=Haemonchus contortus TaxID=6289 RepID=A0A7I4YQS2_HAECO
MVFRDSEDSALTEQYCIENGVLIATSLYYRLSLFVSLVTSIFSATYTTFFLHRFYNKSPFFHKNLKTLFFSLCICCLAHSIINVAMKVLTPSTLIFIVFYGQSFDGLYLSGRVFPPNTYMSANVLLIALLATNITGLLLTVILHLLTPKRRIRMSLSSKFQSKENMIASTLLFWVSTVQFTALCFSQSVLLYLRIYQRTNPMSLAFKEISDFFNFYTLALPVMSTLYFVKVKQQRIRDIRNHVNMKAIGNDGWTNYSAVIERQWR